MKKSELEFLYREFLLDVVEFFSAFHQNITAFPSCMIGPPFSLEILAAIRRIFSRSWYLSRRMRMGLGFLSVWERNVGDRCNIINNGSGKCLSQHGGDPINKESHRIRPLFAFLQINNAEMIASILILQLVHFIHEKVLLLNQAEDAGVNKWQLYEQCSSWHFCYKLNKT